MVAQGGGALAYEGSALVARPWIRWFYATEAETGLRHVERVDAAASSRDAPAVQSGPEASLVRVKAILES